MRLFDWLLPPLCLGCRRSQPSGGIDALNLCPRCRGRLRAVRGRRCPGCLRPLLDPSAPAGFPCGRCRRRPPAFDELLAGWLYEPPLAAVIAGLKYQRLEFLGAALADELSLRFGPRLAGCDAVVPVPLHWTRALRRGYNQSARIARRLAERLGVPALGGLCRRSRTRPQTGLDRRARRHNPSGAFGWRGRPIAGGPHWLVVDDVCTTGATLDAAARALLAAGVGRVSALVAAATPHPEEAGRRWRRPE